MCQYGIRQADQSDYDAVIALDHLTDSDVNRQDFIRRSVRQRNTYVAVQGSIVGYAVLEYSFYNHGFISMLYVHPNHRRKRIGTGLIGHLEGICRTSKLFTSTNQSNTPAQALLMKLGYQRNGVIENLDEGDPELVFFKHINPTNSAHSKVSKLEIPTEIMAYYEEVPEEKRLSEGIFQLEFSRTKAILLRYLPQPPATVLDVGGAAGDYALWLAGNGYEVHLIDPVRRLVEEALRRSEGSQYPIATCQVGDARNLEFSDNMIDAVLMLGPLYHLTEQAECLYALRETHRVLRPDGWLIAAAISRYASSLEYLKNEQLRNATFAEIVKQDLAKGQHRNATDNWDYFTTAYFHRPEDLQSEMEMAGFTCQAVLGVEGPGWMFTDFEERWSDGRQRGILMQIAQQLENEPSIIGLSAHLLAVARKGI